MTSRINDFIIGVVLGLLGGGVVTGVALSANDGPRLHPVSAYCRGFSDGQGQLLMDNGIFVPAQFLEVAPIIDLECDAMVKSNVDNYLRGPLLPGE